MPKTARSARVASKQRVEVVTTNKTVTANESGETYFVSGSSAITLTLPVAADGLYYHVVPFVGMTKFVAVTGSSYFVGGILQLSGTATTMVNGNGTYGTKLTPIVAGTSGSDIMTITAVPISATAYGYIVQGVVSGTAAFTA